MPDRQLIGNLQIKSQLITQAEELDAFDVKTCGTFLVADYDQLPVKFV